MNGYPVTIPQNLQIQFPAAFAPFGQFASTGGFVGHEVSVRRLPTALPLPSLLSMSQRLSRCVEKHDLHFDSWVSGVAERCEIRSISDFAARTTI